MKRRFLAILVAISRLKDEVKGSKLSTREARVVEQQLHEIFDLLEIAHDDNL